MKSLFVIPLVLMSLVSSSSWALSMSDLVIRAGLYYEKFTSTPFTGEVDEGLIRGSIKNGKRKGSWVHYHFNGQLSWKGDFKNGEQEGYWESYHRNGELWKKGNYKNGVMGGRWEFYEDDGTVNKYLTGTYKNYQKVSD